MHRSLKRNLVIGGAALAVAAGAGGAYAATQSSGPTTRQAFLGDVAKRLHVTPQQLNQALNGAFDDQLQAAVKAGKLTQAQADKLKQRLQQKGATRAVPFGFFGFGHGAFHGPGRRGGGFGPMGGPGRIDAVADYLGLNDRQLFQQLASGKSLAQIATQNHKSVKGLEQAMTAAAKARLDKAVAAKYITRAQEQKILARMSARIAAVVNQKGVPFGRRFFPPGLKGGAVPPNGAIPPNGPAFVPPAGAPPDEAPAA